MKKYLYIIIALGMALVSCGGDDDSLGESSTVSGGTTSVTNVNGNTTEKSVYAQRMEVPRLQKGNNYLLLERKDPSTIGVNYMVEWDCVNRAQRWSCWMWNSSNTYKGWERGNWRNGCTWKGVYWDYDPFQPDSDIPVAYRAELSDYSGSGYNRGHICASEDRICSQEVNGQTFYLSNMQPQIYGFNGAVWANMESKVRAWRDATIKNGGEVYVCKGGTIYDVTLDGQKKTGVLGKIANRIPIPKYFFMAVLKKSSSGMYSAMAFWAEHKNDNSTNLAPYMISIDELEKRTGYDFFCNLPDKVEEAVEGLTPNTTEWK